MYIRVLWNNKYLKLKLTFRFQAMPFSEKFILAGCFSRFAQLRILKMPNICDDDLLAKIGESCKNLEEMDFAGSFGLTNQGKCDQKTVESGHIKAFFSSISAMGGLPPIL